MRYDLSATSLFFCFGMSKSIIKLFILSVLCSVLLRLVKIDQSELLQFYRQPSATAKPQVRSDDQAANISVQPSAGKPVVHRQPNNRELENVHEQEDFQCTTIALEKITVKKNSRVYRWTDGSGKVHFGDSRFNNAAAQQVKLKLRKELEYFKLKLSGDEQPTRFDNDLSTRITKVYQLLSHLIPGNELVKVTVDLKIFNHYQDYQQYTQRFSKNLARQADGYYLMRYNQAVVYQRNEKQAGQVALHESTHVINAGIFGYLPRWLNEGLAEYAETMTVTGQSAQIRPNPSWIIRFRINTNYLLSVDELFSANQRDWNGSKRHAMYATSWSLIYFLMSSEDGRQWLGRLLNEKAHQRCERMITRDYIDHFYPGGLDQLQQQFNKWLHSASTLVAHSY